VLKWNLGQKISSKGEPTIAVVEVVSTYDGTFLSLLIGSQRMVAGLGLVWKHGRDHIIDPFGSQRVLQRLLKANQAMAMKHASLLLLDSADVVIHLAEDALFEDLVLELLKTKGFRLKLRRKKDHLRDTCPEKRDSQYRACGSNVRLDQELAESPATPDRHGEETKRCV